MQYARLGSTGLKVSRLILGCGNFGGVGSAPAFWGQGDSEAQAHALMDHAWDAGITTFDTADAYGGGRSETFIGNWLAGKGSGVRDELVLSSKVFNPVGPGPNQRGLSRKHIFQQIDASLRRLRTDRLDLYLIHEPDPLTPLEETLEALDDLIRAGKVLYIGASNIEAWRLARALGVSAARGWRRFDWVQNAFSLLDRSAEREMFPLVADAGLGFTPFSPLAGGWLTGKYRAGTPFPAGSRMTLRPEPHLHLTTRAVFDRLAAFEREAETRGTTMTALALAWVLGHPRVNAAIVGPRTAEQLDQMLGALKITLLETDRQELRTVVEQ